MVYKLLTKTYESIQDHYHPHVFPLMQCNTEGPIGYAENPSNKNIKLY